MLICTVSFEIELYTFYSKSNIFFLEECFQGCSLDSITVSICRKKNPCVLHEMMCLQKPQGLFLLTICQRDLIA